MPDTSRAGGPTPGTESSASGPGTPHQRALLPGRFRTPRLTRRMLNPWPMRPRPGRLDWGARIKTFDETDWIDVTRAGVAASGETPKGPGLIRARISSSGGGDYRAVGRWDAPAGGGRQGRSFVVDGFRPFRGLDRVLKGRGSRADAVGQHSALAPQSRGRFGPSDGHWVPQRGRQQALGRRSRTGA